jgi:ABC-type multidrug transport system fused ATPase/permease subunit
MNSNLHYPVLPERPFLRSPFDRDAGSLLVRYVFSARDDSIGAINLQPGNGQWAAKKAISGALLDLSHLPERPESFAGAAGRPDSLRAMSAATWIHEFNAAPAGALPRSIFRYVLSTSALHQLALLALTAAVALLEVVPLELQRRIVNDLVKHRPYSWVVGLCAVYAGVVIVQGSAKLGLNIYRGWVGEQAKRDLRHRVHTVVETPSTASPAAEAQGIVISMIVAEVEPIGGFVGESVSEPLLQVGIISSVLAYLIHIDPWMALAAIGLFIPQVIFVPFLQSAVNRRTGARIQVLRRLGISMIDRSDGADDDRRIDQAFALEMGIFKLKFTMNFLMNICTHLQIVSALLVGGWWVYTSNLEIGGVVAFISGIGRLNDPWGDLVNYFRDVNVTQIKYRMLADAVNQLAPANPDRAVGPLTATAG